MQKRQLAFQKLLVDICRASPLDSSIATDTFDYSLPICLVTLPEIDLFAGTSDVTEFLSISSRCSGERFAIAAVVPQKSCAFAGKKDPTAITRPIKNALMCILTFPLPYPHPETTIEITYRRFV